MEKNSCAPTLLLQRKPSRQPGRGQRKQAEYVPVCEGMAQRKFPAHRVANLGAGKIKLTGECQADCAPDKDQQQPFQQAGLHHRQWISRPKCQWAATLASDCLAGACRRAQIQSRVVAEARIEVWPT